MNILKYWKNLYNWKNPLNWWRLPGYWCRAIKYGWQRATRGFSDLDCWDLHNFYLEVLEMSLKHLAECNVGCPDKYYDSSKYDLIKLFKSILLIFLSKLLTILSVLFNNLLLL